METCDSKPSENAKNGSRRSGLALPRCGAQQRRYPSDAQSAHVRRTAPLHVRSAPRGARRRCTPDPIQAS